MVGRLLVCLASFAFSSGAVATTGSPLLTAAESACDANRIRGLLERSTVEGDDADRGLSLTLTPSGSFEGLAYTTDPFGLETHLWFSSNREETTLLRNPARPQLSTFSVTRNDPNSDLFSRDGAQLVRLAINPTLDLVDPAPAALIEIDTSSTHAAGKPGRGLDHLRNPCHAGYGSGDEHLLAVLLKVTRARADAAPGTKIATYRAAEANVYRIDVFPEGSDGRNLGQLAARLAVTYQGSRPSSGRLEVLPPCTGPSTIDCSDIDIPVEIQLRTPVSRGEASAIVVSLAAGDPPVTFDFAQLLDGTTWSNPKEAGVGSSLVVGLEPPLLWIGAHPDDEVLVAPLLGEFCLELGLDCTLLVATRGEAGRCLLPDGCLPSVGAVRAEEMAAAAAALGAQLIHWELPDASASTPTGVRVAWAAAAGGEAALLGWIRQVIDGGGFGTVITFDPDHGSTGHPDHRAVGALVLDAIADLGSDPPTTFLLETIVLDDGETLGFEPSAAGLATLDANRWMVRLGDTAWRYLLIDAGFHRSQFDDLFLQRLEDVSLADRRVWLQDP